MIKSLICSAKEKRPQIYTKESIEKSNEGEKVLIFPMKAMQLQPATITSKTNDLPVQNLTVTCDCDDSIKFIFPHHDNWVMMPLNWGEEHQINCDFGEELKDEGGWNRFLDKHQAKAANLEFNMIEEQLEDFQVNTKLEVVHPNDPLMVRCCL